MDMSGMDMANMTAEQHMQMMHGHHESGFSLHLLGMWAGFVVSAGVIAFFVERMGRSLREYDQLIAQTREKALESERMLALATLATAAAHELGTPLSTMAVVAGEMADDCTEQPQLAQSVALLRSQIDRCKTILTSITASAGQQRAESGQRQALDDFLSGTVSRWQDTRPATRFECRLHGPLPAPAIAVDRTLGQALFNLLDNAADASPEQIELDGEWTSTNLSLTLRDHGPGLSPETESRIGTPFFTTKEDSGMGLGLYLARIILERFGGTLQLSNHPQGGAALALAEANPPEYAVVDLKMPGPSGLVLVKRLNELDPATRIVVLTGYASIATAVEAVKLGATHYLAKPADADQIVAAFAKAEGDETAPVSPSPLSVDRMEWEHIQRVLAEHEGNISATARALNMHRRTLQRKLGKYPSRK
ncbi:two component histidine kinase, putative [Ricinus communis]|uniref:histidine kinase n=1 Tax=Ricinus communis TaxID=3988 RepID=B9TBS4_RICCO|nr:two component histidine kinase, putative [Ricinus communis]